jgi:hypothetical protein
VLEKLTIGRCDSEKAPKHGSAEPGCGPDCEEATESKYAEPRYRHCA